MRMNSLLLAERLGADSFEIPNCDITGFATDSESVVPGDLFLAIKGNRFDGHRFVSPALSRGAVASLVEQTVEGPRMVVPNLIAALAKMASSFRDEFDGPVVGITGSAGKTTTKEFVASALSPLGPILKTEGNRNTQFTAPLLWAELEARHRAVVVEMAMRGFDQIRHLASFTRPNIGVVTNIGYSHLEQVGTRDGIAQAKGELLDDLPTNGCAVIWAEDDFLQNLQRRSTAPVMTFGYSEGADGRIESYRPIGWESSEISGQIHGKPFNAVLPTVGRHIALNAVAALLVADRAGVGLDEACAALSTTILPPMRMEWKNYRGARVLLDTYNASPSSMISAIETIDQLATVGRRIAVIGEMRELGSYSEQAHRDVGDALSRARFDRAIFYGPPTEFTLEEAAKNGMNRTLLKMAHSIGEIQEFLADVGDRDTILIKGSRSLELERVIT